MAKSTGTAAPANFRRIDIPVGASGGPTHGWQAFFRRGGKAQQSKFFSDSKNDGTDGALLAANKWLEEELRKVDPTAPRFLLQEIDRLHAVVAEQLEELKELRGSKCSGCGCSDLEACYGGCSWAEEDKERGEGICTNCVTI